MSDIASFLEGVPICAGMSGLELNALSAFLEPRRLSSGEVLFREGEAGDRMFFVRSGLVGSYVVEGDSTRREVYEFKPGSHFGEMAIVEASVRSATAYAKEDSLLLVLEALDFHRLVWEHPGLAVKLLGNMARNLAGWLDEAAGYLGDLARWGESARRKAVLDESTGLFNRRFLEEAMRARAGMTVSAERPCALLAIDLDHFHRINAEQGSKAGDAVIAQAGAAIDGIATAPGREGTVAARLAGDEFAVFLPEAGTEEAAALAEEIRAAIAGMFIEFRDGPGSTPRRTHITASLGCASAPADVGRVEELSAAADLALALAKSSGRNRVVPRPPEQA